MDDSFLVGVVGTSKNVIRKQEAKAALVEAIAELQTCTGERNIVIVSGGGVVPMIAFDFAAQKHWKAVQVVCPRVRSQPKGVRRIEIGRKHGDESAKFIEMIEGIIRIGGGPQSHREIQAFKIAKGEGAMVIEKEVALIQDN